MGKPFSISMSTNAHEKLNDKELLEAIAERNSKAFHTLYKRYKDFVYQRIYYRIDRKEEVEDLVQDFWSSIWERPVKIKTDSAVYFLIHLILVCLSRYYRSKRGVSPVEIENFRGELHELQYTHVFEDLEAEELFALIEQKKDNLSENEQQVYDLCQKQNYSFSEAAILMKTTEQTVRNKFNRSCRMIRMQLEQYYSLNPEIPDPSLKKVV